MILFKGIGIYLKNFLPTGIAPWEECVCFDVSKLDLSFVYEVTLNDMIADLQPPKKIPAKVRNAWELYESAYMYYMKD